ncbi:MAG TPA: 23S rRNA (uracil(1939)-C(5))-methyltransferase RlmD [Pseudogracilibacillus sp.]|nr:23S rRNA (uracil(1939)-C(5))-methyltransferase RlmD [Pseudogracilibacillus sp.]
MAKTKAPVQKNQSIELTFTDITHEGNGVGKVQGYPIFVPLVLPGETASIKVVKVNKKFGFGKLLEIKEASPERETPPCAVFHKCGGCQLQHMSYAMELQMKKNQVKNVMKKIAHMEDVPVHPVIGMEEPWRYRNKIQIPVGEKNGELITGFYRQRSHEIIDDMKTCIIQDHTGDDLQEAVRGIANDLGIRAYDETNHQGDLRHIIVRSAYETGKAMIVLVTRTELTPQLETLTEKITQTYPQVSSVIQNINSARTNVILGKESRTLFGDDYLVDHMGELEFFISANSFYQVNPPQTKQLYEKALEFAAVDAGDTVVDAYCGIGTISLFLAQKAKQVYGVEIVPEAIQEAKMNAKQNNLDNVEFVVGKAETVMPQWTADGLRPDVVVVDPPRKGCDETLLQAMMNMEPERIVYVSCNPSTLARDLRILADGGYKTREIQPVDMFPQTMHIESVTLLEKRKVTT